ncbi:MAG: hypothetical protein WKF83_17815 [Nocardioidaceae bacterium]
MDRLRQIGVPAAPALPAPAASTVTGAVVGLLVTALAALALAIFSAVRGTATGGGWGLLALAAILTVAVVVGTRLLAYARVLEAGTTSPRRAPASASSWSWPRSSTPSTPGGRG